MAQDSFSFVQKATTWSLWWKTMINVYGYLGIKPVMIVSELGSTGESKCVTNHFSKKELSRNDSINGLLRLVVEVAN